MGGVAATAGSMPIRRALRAGMGTNAVSAASAVAGGIIEAPSSAEDRSPRQVFIDSLRSHRLAWVSLWVLVGLIGSCVFLPYLLPWSATQFDYSLLAAAAPSLRHPLGTDSLGRDELARVISAGRISLLIGFTVALISAAIGAAVGVCSGYFGGRVESLLMWVVNVLLSVPAFPLLIALSSVATSANGPAAKMLGAVPPAWRIIIIMSLVGWTGISRVVRSQVISLRKQEFVEAATALGATHRRVMLVHILPNTVSVLAVFTTLTISATIMIESSLSFLGLGVPPPGASWGNMLLEARDAFTAVHYWWLTWTPALMILVTVLCVNFLGDGLRDAFDPKARK